MSVRYLIVDDESIAHDIIRKYCDLVPSLVLEKHCYDAIEAIEFLNQNSVDLIFLDLNMPKLKGFEFLRTLSNPPKIIVTTAYQEYALEGYELNVVDYLLKPFSFERFLKAVNKAIGSGRNSKNTIQDSKSSEEKERLFLSYNKQHYQIKREDLMYVEAARNYCKIVMKEETLQVREKFSKFVERFSDAEFLQVHRSFLVGLRHIKRIEGNQIFMDDASIPIGKSYKPTLLEQISKL